MEAALRYEISKIITELDDEIYPTNAPEDMTKPYLVYTRITTKNLKTLKGYEDTGSLSYMFSVFATRYEDMTNLREKVEKLLLSLVENEIGVDDIYIQDLDINNINETYEYNLKLNRGIIDFTIYY